MKDIIFMTFFYIISVWVFSMIVIITTCLFRKDWEYFKEITFIITLLVLLAWGIIVGIIYGEKFI